MIEYKIRILCGSRDIFKAVSYTHLDVYKRQALNNGLISATISFLRTLVFQIVLIFTLPALLGIDGIWLSVVLAEVMSFVVAIIFFVAKRKKYQYA